MNEVVADNTVRLAGVVVDEKGQGVPLATVRVGYTRFRLPTGTILQDQSWMEITTTREGFFKFCGVPPNTRLTVDAGLGEVMSEQAILDIPDHETGRMLTIRLPSGTRPSGVM